MSSGDPGLVCGPLGTQHVLPNQFISVILPVPNCKYTIFKLLRQDIQTLNNRLHNEVKMTKVTKQRIAIFKIWHLVQLKTFL